MSLLRKEHHHQVYVLGICILAASVPLSRYFMSIAQLILAANWLLEGDIRNKLRKFISDKPALVFSSVFLMHVLGLLYTTDFDYAVKDLRTKIPLLLLPLFFSTSKPLTHKQIQWVYNIFLLAVIGGTIAGISIFLNHQVSDTREMSPYISHIRFSLNICLAIVILVASLRQSQDVMNLRYTIIISLLLAWLLFYLYVSQSFTGYFVLGLLLLTWLIAWSLSTRKPLLRLTFALAVLLIPALLFLYLRHEYRDFFVEKNTSEGKLVWQTSSGHIYTHDTLNHEVISGNRVWLYVCREELRDAWNHRSSLSYDSLGYNGFKIEDVLIRYLTSKGLKKDSQGVAALNKEEIHQVENGVADIEETRGSPLHKRLRKIFWEYQNYLCTGDPSGHSVMMRLEYWKASLGLIRENPVIGVGTGDMNLAFNAYYNDHNSMLRPEWRRRSHNQYLSVTVGFGFLGLLWFLFSLFYPPLACKRLNTFVFGSFFLILLVSMMAEDTIESQDGVTFAAFFFCFFLFVDRELPANNNSE